MTTRESPDCYTIGWIAALPIERAAATALLDDRHEPPEGFQQHQSDHNSYTWGRMGKHDIVIASLPAGVYGTVSAASTASSLLASLPHIRIGLLVGIGGAISRPDQNRDIRLGDIVVSQPNGTNGGVIQYDLGKLKLNQTWEPRGSLNKPPQVLLHALASLQSEHEMASSRIPELLEAMWKANPKMKIPKKKDQAYVHQGFENDRLFSSEHGHVGGRDCATCNTSWEVEREKRETADPEIHYGTIASGNTLIADAASRDVVAKVYGDQCMCVEMEAAGLVDTFPCLVIRGICDYADSHKNDLWQRYASATAAAYAKELLGFVPQRMLQDTPYAMDIKSIGKALKNVEADMAFTKDTVQKSSLQSRRMHKSMILNQLPVAKGASFDSYAEQHNPTCLEGTRVGLLREISDWLDNPGAKPIFWLDGMAGTGKSTISRTVAHNHESRLGASFFFKRGEADRGGMSKLFTTIAADLVVRKPETADHIKAVLEKDPAIITKTASEQFDELILAPLSKSPYATANNSVVLVIDALDECEREDDIKLLILLLARSRNLLKIFLTSRPDLPIRPTFNKIKGEYQCIVLHKIPEIVVEYDIRIFLLHKIAGIREEYDNSVPGDRKLGSDWPGQSSIQSLVKMAIPLFIFAATVCRFLADRKYGNPKALLQEVLEFETISQESQLDATYRPVLNKSISGASRKRGDIVLSEFRNVVGPIILLASPLSTSALEQILGIHRDVINCRLDMLHSVLSVPESAELPVRILHLSFRDYLVNPENKSNPFWIDEKQTHLVMVGNCLRILGSLKQDICGTQAPGTPRSEIKDETIEYYLPPAKQYACLYWVYHMQHSEFHLINADTVYNFLKSHFLHWMEALSLMGRAFESLNLLKTLQSICEPQYCEDLSDFLIDAVRFLRTNITTIDATPLQLYSSLLVFLPKNSKVRMAFEGEITSWIHIKPKVEEDWSQCLQILEGAYAILSAAFSHDSKLIASACGDGMVRIWLADSGECLQALKGDGVQTCVTFSHDSKLIASASYDGKARIWCTDSGECLRTLDCDNMPVVLKMFGDDSHPIWSVAFSHDSVLMASASTDDSIQIWRTASGECLQTLEGHTSSIFSVAFSHNSKLIVSASLDYTIRVWRADSGECLQILDGHTGSVQSVAFSHDSKLIASASHDGAVRIWHAGSGECLQILEGHVDPVRSVAFSHDSKLIASASNDKTVRIWHADSGECLQILKGHSHILSSVAFSHDSKLLVSTSNDRTVRIWRAESDECLRAVEGHGNSKEVTSLAFSHDFRRIASVSVDRTLRVWCADSGECLQTLKTEYIDLQSMVTFSHDSKLIASTFYNKAVGIWRADSGECLQMLEGHVNMVLSMAFSHDSKLIATATSDGTIKIWVTNSGMCLLTLESYMGSINSVAFSVDSKLIASASNDTTVRIWRADSGKCLRTIEGHGHSVMSVTFSHGSTLVASASYDKKVRIWRADSGECLQNIELGVISSHVSFDSNNSHLLTDIGAIHILPKNPKYHSTGSGPKLVPSDHCGYGVSRDSSWVTWNGRNVFSLPVECRHSISVVSGSSGSTESVGTTVVIGCKTGRIIIMRFLPQQMLGALLCKEI